MLKAKRIIAIKSKTKATEPTTIPIMAPRERPEEEEEEEEGEIGVPSLIVTTAWPDKRALFLAIEVINLKIRKEIK